MRFHSDAYKSISATGVGMQHSTVETNGIELHIVELGNGNPVLFCHGFPDTWRGWRRQMEAVADAGYRAIALDMRGYGRSSAPIDAEQYTPFHTVGDLVGLLDALCLNTVTIIGHDFGANVAWNAAMMRPDRFAAVFGISVPFLPRENKSFLEQLEEAGQDDFYMFHQIRPEADAAWADAEKTIPAALYWLSAEPEVNQRFSPFDPKRMFNRQAPSRLPSWINPEDMAYTINEFKRTGFHGGLNYYRAIAPGFRLAAAYKGAVVHQPSYFVTGSAEAMKELGIINQEYVARYLPGLKGYLEIESAGHWPQHEAPERLNAAILDFLNGLSF
jgi:pimeloyl-ACP methyl ester carboxylesterase